jgi:hypothetical protein
MAHGVVMAVERLAGPTRLEARIDRTQSFDFARLRSSRPRG